MRLFSVVLAAFTMLLSSQAGAQRIKDVASIQGVRSNQLVGYGLVVGCLEQVNKTRLPNKVSEPCCVTLVSALTLTLSQKYETWPQWRYTPTYLLLQN